MSRQQATGLMGSIREALETVGFAEQTRANVERMWNNMALGPSLMAAGLESIPGLAAGGQPGQAAGMAAGSMARSAFAPPSPERAMGGESLPQGAAPSGLAGRLGAVGDPMADARRQEADDTALQMAREAFAADPQGASASGQLASGTRFAMRPGSSPTLYGSYPSQSPQWAPAPGGGQGLSYRHRGEGENLGNIIAENNPRTEAERQAQRLAEDAYKVDRRRSLLMSGLARAMNRGDVREADFFEQALNQMDAQGLAEREQVAASEQARAGLAFQERALGGQREDARETRALQERLAGQEVAAAQRLAETNVGGQRDVANIQASVARSGQLQDTINVGLQGALALLQQGRAQDAAREIAQLQANAQQTIASEANRNQLWLTGINQAAEFLRQGNQIAANQALAQLQAGTQREGFASQERVAQAGETGANWRAGLAQFGETAREGMRGSTQRETAQAAADSARYGVDAEKDSRREQNLRQYFTEQLAGYDQRILVASAKLPDINADPKGYRLQAKEVARLQAERADLAALAEQSLGVSGGGSGAPQEPRTEAELGMQWAEFLRVNPDPNNLAPDAKARLGRLIQAGRALRPDVAPSGARAQPAPEPKGRSPQAPLPAAGSQIAQSAQAAATAPPAPAPRPSPAGYPGKAQEYAGRIAALLSPPSSKGARASSTRTPPPNPAQAILDAFSMGELLNMRDREAEIVALLGAGSVEAEALRRVLGALAEQERRAQIQQMVGL